MRPTIVAGVVAVALGFVAILDRGVAGAFDLGYLFVTFLGIVAGATGVYYVSRRRNVSRELTAFDDPERRYRAAVPGDDLDDQFATIPIERRLRTSHRGVRDRIRRAAVRALVTHEGYDHRTAREAVENGTWTEDPVAASFLATDGQYPPRLRLEAFLGRVDVSEIGARRSVEAIVAVIQS